MSLYIALDENSDTFAKIGLHGVKIAKCPDLIKSYGWNLVDVYNIQKMMANGKRVAFGENKEARGIKYDVNWYCTYPNHEMY